MTCNKVGFLLLFSCVLVFAWLTPTALSSQSPSDFQQFKERYASYPYITLVDETNIEVSFDRKGQLQMLVKELSQKLILTDNCNDLSEVKQTYRGNDEIKKLEVYSLVPFNNKFKKLVAPKLNRTTDADNSTYFDDSYCYVGHYPSVTKGTILCSYNEYLTHDIYFPYKFFFGSYMPVEYSNLSITLPDNVKLDHRFAGKDSALLNFSKVKDGNKTIFRWKADRLKEYKYDGTAPSPRYYQPHIILNIAEYTVKGETTRVMGSIDDLFRWEYSKLKNTNKTIQLAVKQLADSITANCKTSREKAKSIYRWVQDNIKYIAIEDGDNGFVPREADLVLKRRYGDCKDKTSLLTALLRAVGERASMCCIGTRLLPYKFSQYPNVGSGNHLIAIWWDENNQPIPLDGTTQHLALGVIPSSIQGKECLIEKGENNFIIYEIPIDIPEKNIVTDSIFTTFDKNSLVGNGVSLTNGEDKSSLIFRLEGKDLVQQKELVSNLLSFAGKKMELDHIKIDGISTLEIPLAIRYQMKLPDYATSAGNRVYINLNLFQRLSNLEIKADRDIPVEAESTHLFKVVHTFSIPDGYRLLELPEESTFSHTKFGYKIGYRRVKNQIIQTSEIVIRFQVIDGVEMEQFGEMIAKLKKCYRNSIVIEKL